ncbi:uncharacterized protein OCT59_019262 [Rhizophagus irregularis]|uniref:uncharacterized protein n=1 Tax=Rhizophagus irregularis TaxID=588596 RepID=UPI0033206D9A|nr:hypothetical protein OCT59_019262 [Rhizophagus irregularis]
MSNMSNNAELVSNSNDWNKWIEEEISKKLIKYYEYNQFYNIQEIGSGSFGKIQLQRKIDFHDNVIRFYGVTTSIKETQKKEYSLVIEYAENGTLREYLKENFKYLTWNDKFNLAFQLVCAVSCLHNEGIVHRDLNSKNVLIHRNIVKLADFGLSKRIEETYFQSKIFGLIPYNDPQSFNSSTSLYVLNEKSDVYSIGVLLWEISSGRPPFSDELNYLGLVMKIFQGLREKPILDTPEEYIKIYTDCWNIEPDNRPTINQVVVKLKAIMTKENIIIKDFHLYDNNKDIQSLNNQQPVNISESVYSLYGVLSKFIQSFNMMNTSMSSSNQFENSFDTIVSDLINLNYDKFNNLLLNSQNSSNSLVLLGELNFLGIGISINKQKAFELYQKAAYLGNSFGINSLGYCYQNGIGTDIDKKKAFELYQKAADLGNSSGTNSLGYCYRNGIGTDIDKKKAFELYQKAADLGNLSGIYNLGYCYQNGIGTDIDKKKAFELYQKPADLGNSSGINSLGYCYRNGIGTDIDKKKAFELYQKAADLGNSSGIRYCYQNGIGTDIDKKKAFELYQKAADLGNSSGISNLGDCYQYGIDIDKKKAFELYQKAADLRNLSGTSNLGDCYENRTGTDIDKKKAFNLYQKAADLGNSSGINSLGHCYLYRIGSDINETTSFNLTSSISRLALLSQNSKKSINFKQDASRGLLLNKHKIILTSFIKNGKWDISLYKGQPLVYTSIDDSSDICINFPIIEITYKDELKSKYFRINSNGDEFFTRKISAGGRLFIKESSSITRTPFDILKFYLFCVYNLARYSIEVQSNNLFTLNLLQTMETLDGEEINTHEKLTKWVNNLHLLQKTLDEEKPNSHEELFNWMNNLHQMKIIDVISYGNIISVSNPQLEYRKLDDIVSYDERLLGIINFKEKLNLKDWVGNAAYDNLISWTIDFHLFRGLITNQNYKTEVSKKIAIDFIKIPRVNISNKSCLKMIRPSTKLEFYLISNNIVLSDSISSFPFIKWNVGKYEGFSYILVKFEHYEILLEEDNVKPAKEFEQVIEKALDSMKPLEELQRVFDEFGHIFPQRITLGRSLKIILPNPSLNDTFENTNDVNEIVKSLDKLDVPYLITQEGESIKKNNLTSWIVDTNDSLKVIEFDKIIPLYKILKVEQQERINDILDKFNDLQNSRIIMTGITDLKDLEYLKDDLNNGLVNNISHYKRIDVELSLKDENYEVYGSVISENNTKLEEIYVNFGLYDFNGFYAIIKKLKEISIDITKCYISWMIIGRPLQLSIFSPNNRKFQVHCIKNHFKLQSNQLNYRIETSFNLSEGYTIFAHAYHSSTNHEPNNIIKLIKWSKNSINFQITNLSQLNLVDDFLTETENVINIELNICILFNDYERLKIDNNEGRKGLLIGYTLTKKNFDESLKQSI